MRRYRQARLVVVLAQEGRKLGIYAKSGIGENLRR